MGAPIHDNRIHPRRSFLDTTSIYSIPTRSPRTAQLTDAMASLFTPDLLSPEVQSALPQGYVLRALRRDDFASGFLDCLRVLTTVGDVTDEGFGDQFDQMQKQGGYYIVVIEDPSREEAKVVATGALIVERKFIHSLGAVGHIEDIAVARDQQGKKLGLRLIQALDFVAEKVGCYKSILDCSEANEGFYIKCGFRRAGLQMAHYYEGNKSKA